MDLMRKKETNKHSALKTSAICSDIVFVCIFLYEVLYRRSNGDV
jgi:hypothetical protein